MSQPDPEKKTITSASELMRPGTRRNFVRTLCVGGTVIMLPSVLAACRGDDDDDDGNPLGPNVPAPVTGISFDLRTDVGIFQIIDLLEQIEGLFYTAVVRSATFNSFNTDEREVFTDLRDAEIMHREIVRAFLGNPYIANEVTYHQMVLDAIDNTLIPNAQNAELRALLEQSRPSGAALLLTRAACNTPMLTRLQEQLFGAQKTCYILRIRGTLVASIPDDRGCVAPAMEWARRAGYR